MSSEKPAIRVAPPPPPPPRRRNRSRLLAGALSLLLSGDQKPKPAQGQLELESRYNHTERLRNSQINTYFDDNPEFFKTITINGEFSPAERARRIKKLSNGVTIFEDAGLIFYMVRPGDTISKIRDTLAKMPEFSYLNDQLGRLVSFNISPKDLRAGMWLPIPYENRDRYITDEQFVVYADRGIEDTLKNPKYGPYVREILGLISREELVATLVAIAKQEAGGLPIGRFEMHRWEAGHHVFSFSLFHVLMEQAGLRARRGINKSEGQCYHPQIATQLFFGFLKEKGVKASEVFPFKKRQKLERFAYLYNGPLWRKNNYVNAVSLYYNDALEMVETLEGGGGGDEREERLVEKIEPAIEQVETEKKPEPKTQSRSFEYEREIGTINWETIGGNNLTIALKNSNFRRHRNGEPVVFTNNGQLHLAARKILRFLRNNFNSDTYYPNEKLALGIDAQGRYILFKSSRIQGRGYIKIRI